VGVKGRPRRGRADRHAVRDALHTPCPPPRSTGLRPALARPLAPGAGRHRQGRGCDVEPAVPQGGTRAGAADRRRWAANWRQGRPSPRGGDAAEHSPRHLPSPTGTKFQSTDQKGLFEPFGVGVSGASSCPSSFAFPALGVVRPRRGRGRCGAGVGSGAGLEGGTRRGGSWGPPAVGRGRGRGGPTGRVPGGARSAGGRPALASLFGFPTLFAARASFGGQYQLAPSRPSSASPRPVPIFARDAACYRA
jgi:hypothetical protein